VVEAVFKATVFELARTGYAALRVEDVAARAKVNKTTIYRRWPQKRDLVAATFQALVKPEAVVPTGSLERDLHAALKSVVAYASSPAGRAAARVMLGSHNDPEVDAIASEVRAQIRAEHAKIFQRAIDAGQLPKKTSIDLVQQIIFMPVLMRALVFHEPVDDTVIRDIVALVLEGAKSTARR
jgi:AcrR family transcriptional regulator